MGCEHEHEKTEYMRIGFEDVGPDLEIRQIKRSGEYKYLRIKVSSECDIKHSVLHGQRTVQFINSLLWPNSIILKMKMTTYRVTVEPILTYRSECWQLSEKPKEKVDTIVIDYLRWSCQIQII